MTKLEFGRANSFEQAMLRLPEKNHKKYWRDRVIGRLADLKEMVQSTLETENQQPLEKRWVPMKLEDIKELERISFRRQPIVTVGWEYLQEQNPMGKIFETGPENCKWWQISEMCPTVKFEDLTLLCVETNKKEEGYKNYRYDENSRFDLLLLSPEEEWCLMEDLKRNGNDIAGSQFSVHTSK